MEKLKKIRKIGGRVKREITTVFAEKARTKSLVKSEIMSGGGVLTLR